MDALIYDADADHRQALEKLVTAEGFNALSTEDGEEAKAHCARGPALAFIDIDAGFELIDEMAFDDISEVILMGQEDDHVRVNQGIRRGATYFFCKPFDEDFVRQIVRDLRTEFSTPKSKPKAPQACIEQFGMLRGDSEPMRRIYRTIRKVAPLDTTVFLTGESGTGKDLAAKTIHMQSARADQEFVALNCAAIPHDLFESELFGHEKGSFSGAANQHSGFFERADGGTLFLDEITEIPIDLQAKLLRALENRAFRRVGGEQDTSSDVRIIASSNLDPDEAVAEEKLRHDLYFRLARFQITMPPLRTRGDDIIGLALFFLDELDQEHGEHRTLTQHAIDLLSSYPWPGNVRELKSAIERAYILTRENIDADDLEGLDTAQAITETADLQISSRSTIADAEKRLILAALETFDDNKSKAAESLGISLKTLYNRLQAYGADDAT